MHPSSRFARAVAAVGAVALLGALAACTAEPMPTPTPIPTVAKPAPSGDGVLRVGSLVPTSGTFTFLAAAQVAGIEAAIKEINAAGGVNGAPVEIFHRDSGDAGTQTAETSLADLLTKPVDVVIGPSSSVLVERLLPTITAEGIPLISPAATLTSLTTLDDDGLVFRTIPAYGLQGRAIAEALAGGDGPADVALIHLEGADGDSLLAHLTAGLEDAGGTLVAAESFSGDAAAIPAIVEAIAAEEPDAVVLATAGSQAEQTKTLIQQLTSAGLGGGKLWLTSQNTADYSQALPAGLLEGAHGVIDGFEPGDDLMSLLKGFDPNLTLFRYAMEAYDATILAALAATVAGDDGGPSIAAALQDVSRGGIKCTTFGECLDVLGSRDDIDYDGVTGPLNWDDAGDILPAYYGVFAFNAENKYVFERGFVVG